MKNLLVLVIFIFPLLFKAGTTVIHIETEGLGTIQHPNADTVANTNGAFFWDGTKWVTNETTDHMFFTNLNPGERLKNYNVVDVTDGGGLASITRGVVYSTSSQPTLESGTAIADTTEGEGENSVTITGLTHNTTYGEPRRFTTPVIIKDIDVGSLPQNLAVNCKTNKVYVANNLGNSVTIINGKTVAVTQPTTVGIFGNELPGVLVYPNPFSDGFYVNPGNKSIVSSVSNLNGRTIIRKNVSSPEFIPTQELPEGVYLIDLTGDTFTVKRKMIKNSILFSYNL